MHFNPKPLSNLKISSPSKVIWHSYFYSVWRNLFGVSSLLLSVIWSKCVYFVFLLIFFSFGLQQHFAQRNLFLLFESARIFFFVYTFVFLSLILEMILAKLYSYIDFERVQSVSHPNAMFIFLLTSSFFKKKSCSNLACSCSSSILL